MPDIWKPKNKTTGSQSTWGPFIITQAVRQWVLELACFLSFFSSYFFGEGWLPVCMLIGWRAANYHVLCSWAKNSWADDMVQVAKNKMWVSEVCFACLTWLYGLFVRTLISPTNTYTGCGRPTLLSVFGLGRSIELKVYSTELWNELHEQMYRNVLQCAPNGLSTLVSASLVMDWLWSKCRCDHEVIPLFFSKLPINVPNWQFVWFYWFIIHGMVLFLPQNGPVLLGSHLPITAPDTTGFCVFPCMSVQHY